MGFVLRFFKKYWGGILTAIIAGVWLCNYFQIDFYRGYTGRDEDKMVTILEPDFVGRLRWGPLSGNRTGRFYVHPEFSWEMELEYKKNEAGKSEFSRSSIRSPHLEDGTAGEKIFESDKFMSLEVVTFSKPYLFFFTGSTLHALNVETKKDISFDPRSRFCRDEDTSVVVMAVRDNVLYFKQSKPFAWTCPGYYKRKLELK